MNTRSRRRPAWYIASLIVMMLPLAVAFYLWDADKANNMAKAALTVVLVVVPLLPTWFTRKAGWTGKSDRGVT